MTQAPRTKEASAPGRPGLTHVTFLGYGLLEAWSFCMFYGHNCASVNEAPVFSSLSTGIAAPDVSSIAVMASTLLIALMSSTHISSHRSRRLSIACGVASMVGTLLSLFGNPGLGTIGIVLAGVANAWLWVSWGQPFTRFNTAQVEHVAIESALMQIGAILLAALLPPFFQAIYLASLPMIATAMWLVGMASLPPHLEANPSDAVVAMNKTDRIYTVLQLIMCLGSPVLFTYLLVGYANGSPASPGSLETSLFLGMLVFAIVLVLFIRFTPSIDPSSVYRLIVSIVAIGCSGIALGFPQTFLVTTLTCSMLLCQFLTLIYLAKLQKRGFGNALFTFSVGWLINHSCGFVGSLLGSTLRPLGEATTLHTLTLTTVLLACATLLGMCAEYRRTPVCPPVPRVDERAQTLESIAVASRLSARETQIFKLLAAGRSAPFIRDELGISLNTVHVHIRHIYDKLGVRSRQDLLDLIEKDSHV